MKPIRNSQPSENGDTGTVNEVAHEPGYNDAGASYEKRHTMSTMLSAIAKRTREEVRKLVETLKNSKSYRNKTVKAI